MKYICGVGLCILWLMNEAQHGVFGLHVQQAPEIVQRITRQAARYGSGGQSFRPSGASFNIRQGAADLTASLMSSQLNTVSAGAGKRPVAVGAYSFGGMASGRPTNGNSFVISNSRSSQPQGQAIIGNGSVASNTAGRPQQLQQALLKAAQYQLQQQQHQQLRRHLTQQHLQRQRPANPYQQYN